jgi:hypothetical protein
VAVSVVRPYVESILKKQEKQSWSKLKWQVHH